MQVGYNNVISPGLYSPAQHLLTSKNNLANNKEKYYAYNGSTLQYVKVQLVPNSDRKLEILFIHKTLEKQTASPIETTVNTIEILM